MDARFTQKGRGMSVNTTAEQANDDELNGLKMSFGRIHGSVRVRTTADLAVSPRTEKGVAMGLTIRVSADVLKTAGWEPGQYVAMEFEKHKGDLYFIVRRVPSSVGVKLIPSEAGGETHGRAYFTVGERAVKTLFRFAPSGVYECKMMTCDKEQDRVAFWVE